VQAHKTSELFHPLIDRKLVRANKGVTQVLTRLRSLARSLKKSKVEPSVDRPSRDEQSAYKEKLASELETFRDQVNIHELPPIFHYWSGKYLRPKLEQMGFSDPDDFFVKKIDEALRRGNGEHANIVSIGSGNCDIEVRIAVELRKLGHDHFTIECVEINPQMLERGLEAARTHDVVNHLSFSREDFNLWRPAKTYNVAMANQSLHHVCELEHLFESIRDALRANGRLIVSDMIGRNGHQLWPEAKAIVEEFWKELPSRYKYNHQLSRQEDEFLDWDCSHHGFEGIRAQDILPLLPRYFNFELFLPFANVVSPFIGRGFGHNFDASNESDTAFIDRVHARDDAAMQSGLIKPTQMLAVLTTQQNQSVEHIPGLTPEFCVRHPS
jgi:SAM-dependent methyltransferase